MLSGDKVMSRRLVKSMPSLSSGFEIETELAVDALSLRVPVADWSDRLMCSCRGSRAIDMGVTRPSGGLKRGS